MPAQRWIMDRLPRIRGDRPPGCVRGSVRPKATPHTRGSTFLLYKTCWNTTGYPAYAGIDLREMVVMGLDLRLPRIRGDRPFTDRSLRKRSKATPHTRGSTSTNISRTSAIRGYPAYAGIDPCRAHFNLQSPWLPRIRGDRPEEGGCCEYVSPATPHTRGSTFVFRSP